VFVVIIIIVITGYYYYYYHCYRLYGEIKILKISLGSLRPGCNEARIWFKGIIPKFQTTVVYEKNYISAKNWHVPKSEFLPRYRKLRWSITSVISDCVPGVKSG